MYCTTGVAREEDGTLHEDLEVWEEERGIEIPLKWYTNQWKDRAVVRHRYLSVRIHNIPEDLDWQGASLKDLDPRALGVCKSLRKCGKEGGWLDCLILVVRDPTMSESMIRWTRLCWEVEEKRDADIREAELKEEEKKWMDARSRQWKILTGLGSISTPEAATSDKKMKRLTSEWMGKMKQIGAAQSEVDYRLRQVAKWGGKSETYEEALAKLWEILHGLGLIESTLKETGIEEMRSVTSNLMLKMAQLKVAQSVVDGSEG